MAEETPRLVTVEEAAAQPYATVLAYPSPDRTGVYSRIQQLKGLGVARLEFSGHLKLDGLSVLGKGVAGMVVVGVTSTRRVALKLRRSDSRRDSVENEASMLQAANAVKVGPRFLGSAPDVLVMELVVGESLPRWLSSLQGRGRRAKARAVIASLLSQCFRLDQAGLDHGEHHGRQARTCVRRGLWRRAGDARGWVRLRADQRAVSWQGRLPGP